MFALTSHAHATASGAPFGRWRHLPRTPLEESDPAVLLEAEPAVDGITHLRGTKDTDHVAEIPRLPKRRERHSRPDTLPPDALDGADEIDARDPSTEEQRGRGHRLSTQPPKVVPPRTLVSESQPAVHLPDPLGLDWSFAEARAERLDPRCEPFLFPYSLDDEAFGYWHLFRHP